jgi:hypothetical protein
VSLAQGEDKPFSGKTKVYDDPTNKWSVTLPEEFQQQESGQHVWWTGPGMSGGSASVHMNITDFPGVHFQALYEGNKQSLQAKDEFTDKRALKLKVGSKVYPGMTYKEVGLAPGTKNPKGASDIHRWYVEIYAGNGPGGQARIYSMVLGGPYEAFTNGTLPPIYDAIIKSLAVK